VSNNHNIKTFTAIDIEKYHKGLLTPAQMHEMEKAALDDPFLADAIEGYSAPGVNVAADIRALKKRLADRVTETDERKVIGMAPVKKAFPWLRIAALIVLVAGAAFMIYQFGINDDNKDSVAQAKNKPVEPVSNQISPSQEKAEGPAPADSVFGNITTMPSDSGKDLLAKRAWKEELINQNSPILLPGDSLTVSSESTIEKAPFKGDIAKTEAAPPLSKQIKDEKKPDTSLLVRDKSVDGFYYDTKKDDEEMYARLRKSNQASEAAKSQYKNSNNFGATMAQQKLANRTNVFRGRITDNSNNALPFANITNVVDNVGTYSDARGNFTLISPDSVLNVQVRSIGFENNTIQLQNTVTDNQVVMQEDRSLSEVVVSRNKSLNSKRARTSTMVLEEPEPLDGWVNYDTYLANNLNVPDNIKNKQSSGGEVKLSFEINKNGEPVNITIDQSLCASCDKEAIRLIKEGPKWKRKAKKKRTSVTISF
jgi:hypothetical protein